MPFKSSKMKFTREQDGRVKLTDQDKIEIVELYKLPEYSQRKLGAMYGVSRSMVSILVNPSC